MATKPPVSVSIEGAEALTRLSRKFDKEAKGLKRELANGMRKRLRPLGYKARDEIVDNVPASGGLRKRVKASTVNVKTVTGRNARVRITIGKKGSGIRSLDRHGKVSHPVFGNRSRWVTQEVPGARNEATGTLRAGQEQAQVAAAEVMRDVARRLKR